MCTLHPTHNTLQGTVERSNLASSVDQGHSCIHPTQRTHTFSHVCPAGPHVPLQPSTRKQSSTSASTVSVSDGPPSDRAIVTLYLQGRYGLPGKLAFIGQVLLLGGGGGVRLVLFAITEPQLLTLAADALQNVAVCAYLVISAQLVGVCEMEEM